MFLTLFQQLGSITVLLTEYFNIEDQNFQRNKDLWLEKKISSTRICQSQLQTVWNFLFTDILMPTIPKLGTAQPQDSVELTVADTPIITIAKSVKLLLRLIIS